MSTATKAQWRSKEVVVEGFKRSAVVATVGMAGTAGGAVALSQHPDICGSVESSTALLVGLAVLGALVGGVVSQRWSSVIDEARTARLDRAVLARGGAVGQRPGVDFDEAVVELEELRTFLKNGGPRAKRDAGAELVRMAFCLEYVQLAVQQLIESVSKTDRE